MLLLERFRYFEINFRTVIKKQKQNKKTIARQKNESNIKISERRKLKKAKVKRKHTKVEREKEKRQNLDFAV